MNDVRIKVGSCVPPANPNRDGRNYCVECGYPIVWDRHFGWIAGRQADPEWEVYWAPPARLGPCLCGELHNDSGSPGEGRLADPWRPSPGTGGEAS